MVKQIYEPVVVGRPYPNPVAVGDLIEKKTARKRTENPKNRNYSLRGEQKPADGLRILACWHGSGPLAS
jgi:hypothetical protein